MRRDIQLLRGLAVLAVVFYHAQFALFPGGYLGVDLFFVISGFVITGRLIRSTGTLKEELLTFYKRRVKRILPSSLAVILLTTIASPFFLAKISFARFAEDGLASAFMSGNILFAHQHNDYLSQSLDPSPFLHYWSLGVEEQFYILWPILFFVIIRKRKQLLIPFFAASAIFAIWYTTVAPINSFYLPFSRVFEFLAGAIIAMTPRTKVLNPRRAALYFFFPLYLVINLFMSVDTSYQTPGLTTLFLVLMAMIILWTGTNIPERSKFGNLLIWFGDISFTLYLVHWPVTVIFMANTDRLTTYDKWEIVLISTAIAILLSKYIETPMRFDKKFFLTLPQWGLAILVTSALTFSGFNALAKESSGLAIDLAKPANYTNGCHLTYTQSWPKSACAFANTSASETFMLVGDSHAAQWFPAVEKIAKDRNARLISITKSSCPAISLAIINNTKADVTCSAYQKRLITEINMAQPRYLLISNYTEHEYTTVTASADYAKAWVAAEAKFLSELAIPKQNIFIVGDTPNPIKDSTTCLSRHSDKPSRCDFAFVRSDTTQAVAAMKYSYIDTAKWLCTNSCAALYGKSNVYRDNSHISVSTAVRLAPKLSSALTQ